MKYYMINPYKDIPRYAEVEFVGHCFDSGYSCIEVRYKDRTYKPFERDVKCSERIIEDFTSSQKMFEESRLVYNMTVRGEFR